MVTNHYRRGEDGEEMFLRKTGNQLQEDMVSQSMF
jgi:hypothetical protein